MHYHDPEGFCYSIEYQELKQSHEKLCALSDKEFVAALPEAIHLACAIAWFKGLSAEQVLADWGVIHGLAHILHIPEEPMIGFAKIREKFATDLRLA